MVLITTTTNSQKEAKKIAHSLLKKNLVGCINIVPCVSMYTWQGAIKEDNEYKLFIKSQEKHFSDIEKDIENNHSYDTPEISCVSIGNISQKYYNWLLEVT